MKLIRSRWCNAKSKGIGSLMKEKSQAPNYEKNGSLCYTFEWNCPVDPELLMFGANELELERGGFSRIGSLVCVTLTGVYNYFYMNISAIYL